MIPELTHAPYVWSSYGLFAVIFAWQFLQPMIKRSRLIDELKQAAEERRAAGSVQS
ncbi:MAG: heme exporter protein CcmD [Wenzhouxiangellaceae bacterium]|nr:heme exporter protein CcmD [Wenzhouxiangellaceae bacterium]